ncbi:MAG: hypothetical protein ACFFCS_22605 [Candidatus Hodarchaeota archaeon]
MAETHLPNKIDPLIWKNGNPVPEEYILYFAYCSFLHVNDQTWIACNRATKNNMNKELKKLVKGGLLEESKKKRYGGSYKSFILTEAGEERYHSIMEDKSDADRKKYQEGDIEYKVISYNSKYDLEKKKWMDPSEEEWDELNSIYKEIRDILSCSKKVSFPSSLDDDATAIIGGDMFNPYAITDEDRYKEIMDCLEMKRNLVSFSDFLDFRNYSLHRDEPYKQDENVIISIYESAIRFKHKFAVDDNRIHFIKKGGEPVRLGNFYLCSFHEYLTL